MQPIKGGFTLMKSLGNKISISSKKDLLKGEKIKLNI